MAAHETGKVTTSRKSGSLQPDGPARLKRPQPQPDIIGWREIVSLPDLGIATLKAKIDTGARTSALHAVDQQLFEREGRKWVRFKVPASAAHKTIPVETPLIDERDIKNTSGIPERRFVIRTTLLLGRHHWSIEASLANRAKMEFDLILGRSAIRRRGVLVDPGRSYVAGAPSSQFHVGAPIVPPPSGDIP
ncbi:ATP-dependent zinc protease family protein [Stappia indica]|uniref:ATP-dependent zinc protease family protein n=1 Tax=Stappia indica TaxID=538381 RepID=UPI001CD43D26|nr:RimK/LysX family protein [Stappia indica]MCA1297193.1 RimK/LysX family protein [Stappia indica]